MLYTANTKGIGSYTTITLTTNLPPAMYMPNFTGEAIVEIQAPQGVTVLICDEKQQPLSRYWFEAGKSYYIKAISTLPTVVQYTVTIKQRVKYGDVNANGFIDSKDVTLLKRYILHLLPEDAKFYEKPADVNGDGKVNSTDYSLLKRYLLGKITSFPAGVYVE
jgi:hypothetical protein